MELPQYNAWSLAAVHLLQGHVDSDQSKVWDAILQGRSPLELHFARLGLDLVVDETEGIAYLRQIPDDDLPAGYDQLPKLFRSVRLGYDATLLCILLRDEYRRFEEEDLDNQRCVIETSVLADQWQSFFPPHDDEVRVRRDLSAALRKLEALGFIKKFATKPEAWEVRRMLKARLPLSELESLRQQLITSRSTPADVAAEENR
jgi:hypothetical protein